MTDNDTLRAIAKAMGYPLSPLGISVFKDGQWLQFHEGANIVTPMWNPLTDDADCARMCAALRIDISWTDLYVEA